MEELFLELLQEYGYIVLFVWSIIEGELGLILAGIMSHTGHMNLYIAIFIGGLGGFTGDQIYFHIGRYNKNFIQRKLHSQRRKFAIAHLLLKKHGWPIIFAQRYIYGLRTVIPMSIGITKYSAKNFAIINLISAWTWATITILPAWYFGEKILHVLGIAREFWYIAIPFAIIILVLIYKYFTILENKLLEKKNERRVKSTTTSIN